MKLPVLGQEICETADDIALFYKNMTKVTLAVSLSGQSAGGSLRPLIGVDSTSSGFTVTAVARQRQMTSPALQALELAADERALPRLGLDIFYLCGLTDYIIKAVHVGLLHNRKLVPVSAVSCNYVCGDLIFVNRFLFSNRNEAWIFLCSRSDSPPVRDPSHSVVPSVSMRNVSVEERLEVIEPSARRGLESVTSDSPWRIEPEELCIEYTAGG